MAHRPDSLVIRNGVENKVTEQKRMFLDVLSKVATVTVACKAVGMNVASVYRWRQEDEQFAEDWDNALTYAFEALESATYLKVAKVLQDDIKRISMPEAKLIEMLLAGAKPEKYRQRGVEIDNSVNTSNLTIDWASVPDAIFQAFRDGKLTVEDVYQQTLLINTQQKTPSSSDEGV